MSTITTAEQIRLLGVPIDALTMSQAVALAERAIRRRSTLLVAVVNAAKLVNLRRRASLRRAILSADLVLADGMSVVWATRLLRRPVPERVTGIDLMMALLARADQCGYRVYCLGATDAVLEQAVTRIQRDFPHARIVGRHNGYFSPDQAEQIAADIAAVRPDLLFVAMSSPKKEEFLAQWVPVMGVPVCHGVGGAFDVLAGRTKRAPQLWRRLGLEWLYRVLQEPRRLARRYLVTNTLFSWLVLREMLGQGGTDVPARS